MRYSLLLALFLLPSTSQAQRVPDHVALARICWSEAGVSSRETCAALHTALRAKAAHRGVPWPVHARAYSTSVFRASHAQARRPWLVDLHAHGRRPALWGHSRVLRGLDPLPWSRWRSRWFSLLEFTQKLIERPWNPCTHPDTGEALEPWDWGVGPAVRRYRRIYPQAVEVACPCDSRRCNVFLRPWPESGGSRPEDS